MPKALLIVSFSPIQGFIAESRRVADLSASSAILSRLATAARRVLSESGEVIYPFGEDGLDAPNVLVSVLSDSETLKNVANNAEVALHDEWQRISQHVRLQWESQFRPDSTWNIIWDRQIKDQWDFFWGAAIFVTDSEYKNAYIAARKSLDAVKRARYFEQVEESGLKDSLSGVRSALRMENQNAKDYWQNVFDRFATADDVRLRENERLDAIGLVKRFYAWNGQKNRFQSTSDVAASAYLRRADQKLLSTHASAVYKLLGKTHEHVEDGWPEQLDADFLYEETFTVQRLRSNNYGKTIDPKKLESALTTLGELQKNSGRPPTYYAIVVMDGDNMGRAVDGCKTKEEHKEFSRHLSRFATDVYAKFTDSPGQIVYAGGDDILALLPLDNLLSSVSMWAEEFGKIQNPQGYPCSASAGISIVHHRSPLGAALRAARQAEKEAKNVNRESKRNGTVCIDWIKRSGEPLRVHSSWNGLAAHIHQMQVDFANGLSMRLPYELSRDADIATALSQEARLALLKRLIQRHVEKADRIDIKDRAMKLFDWSMELDLLLHSKGLLEVSQWLTLARFLNQQIDKGGER